MPMAPPPHMPQREPLAGSPSMMGSVLDLAKRAMGRGGPPAAAAPPDPYQDRAAILQFFKECKEEAYSGRWIFERTWWRNILYILNRQWIYYDVSRNQWQDKRLAKWIPRPVTNKMADTLQAIRSVFDGVNLAIVARPNGDTPRDVSTASVADAYSGPLQEEHQIKKKFSDADFWMIATGNVFLHPRIDKRGESGTVTVALEQCGDCGQAFLPSEILNAGNACPQCKSQNLLGATSPDGAPMARKLATGKGETDVCSPFEIAGPTGYASFDDWPYLIRSRWRAKHWWEKNYPALAKTLMFDKMPADRSLQLLKAIPSASEIGTSPLSREGGPDGDLVEGLTEYELWAKPSKTYPKGLFCRIVGDKGQEQILDLPDEPTCCPLPYKTVKDEPLWNWIHIPYERIGGRVWGRSPLDIAISKQDTLNQVDSLILLIVNRVANPVWLEPRGADVKKFTGEPGLVVKWNPLANNAKPERLEGQNVPASLFTLRQQQLDDIEALTGTYDVIKGAKPAGVEAFSALQLLVERSQSRFTTVLQERGEAFRKWYMLALEIERTYGPQERVFSVMGPNATWTFNHFQQADLSGNVSITIEDGSQAPKTNLGQRAAVEQLRNFGVIQPETDPDQQYQILKTFGQTNLMPSLDVQVKTALREQDEWERWASEVQQVMQPVMGPAGAMVVDPATNQPAQQPGVSTPMPGVRMIWNNDQVHIVEHTKWLNSDTVTNLLREKPWLLPYANLFLEQHQQAMMVQQMQSQIVAGGGAQGPEAGGGANALSSSNRESGATKGVPSGNGQRADNRGPE